jgi:hypothetical protein
MCKLRCDEITEGLRSSEVVAHIIDVRGRRHFIRVERDFLSDEKQGSYLTVGIVNFDPKTHFVLVELPHEAETGANRLWVKEEQLDKPVEVYS